MRKQLIVLAFVVVALSGCSARPFVIYNGCKGSWVRVRDGRGDILVSRLDYGNETPVDLRKAYPGRLVELLAVGFSLRDGRPLGSASTSVYVPDYGGPITGPSQLQPWEISYLYTTDQKGGCEH